MDCCSLSEEAVLQEVFREVASKLLMPGTALAGCFPEKDILCYDQLSS